MKRMDGMTAYQYELWLWHRIKHLRPLLEGMEAERRELARRRIQGYYNRLETSCNPSREMVKQHD